MIELKPIVQVISSISFFGIGTYLLVSKRIKSANIFEDKVLKIAGGFLVVLGISLAILMLILKQPRAWQTGLILMYAAATISCLFSGIYNLYYRQKKSAEHNDVNILIIGCSLILIGVWSAILFFLSIS